MKTRTFAGAVALAVLTLSLAACGARQLILSVDLLSFVAATDRDTSFAIPLPLPVSFDTTYVIIPDQRMSLFQGLSNLTESPSVEIEAAIQVVGTRDSADAVLEVYISDEDTAPRSTMALFSSPVRVRNGQTQTISFSLASLSPSERARVAELITREAVRVGADVELTIPALTRPAGTVTITQLDATVRASRPKL